MLIIFFLVKKSPPDHRRGDCDEIKWKAIDEAYIDLYVQDFPSWQDNFELMDWLKELCK